MTADESPAGARRRLRLALRRAREARQLTQTQVADALEWSLSKVQRIESGEVRISSTDLRAMLEKFGVSDPDQIDRLVSDSRISRKKGWWEAARYRDHLTPGLRQVAQLEGEATSIRVFQPSLLPGLLQTRAYAEAIIEAWGDELSPQTRAARVDLRIERRRYLFSRPVPPLYCAILDESILLRDPVEPAVMAAQFQELLAVGERPNVSIRIVRLQSAVRLAMVGQFMILDLEDREDSVLYRESGLGDELVQDPLVIAGYREIFKQAWKDALPEDASARLIARRAIDVLGSGGR